MSSLLARHSRRRRRRIWALGVLTAGLVSQVPQSSAATRPAEELPPHVYALHIGWNEAPEEIDLPPLRYADDDAVRFFSFTSHFAHRAIIAAALDRESWRRLASLSDEAPPALVEPSADRLAAELRAMARDMKVSHAEGHPVHLWLTYSGHGVKIGDSSALTVKGGALSASWLVDSLGALPVDSIHLLVDACHAGGLVEGKGEPQGSTELQPLSEEERERLFGWPLSLGETIGERLPHAGGLFAGGLGAETHEWTRIQSGVFTHEVLSALAGPADVNGDGRLGYSEVAAYVAAANQGVEDPRARPEIVVHAPRGGQAPPLVDFRWLERPSFLSGDGGSLGHFAVETESGLRLVEANLEPGHAVVVLLPSDVPLWLKTEQGESRFVAQRGSTLDVAQLTLVVGDEVGNRGMSGWLFAEGLFRARFGQRYYLGWLEATEQPGVDLAAVAFELPAPAPADVPPSRAEGPSPVGPWLLTGASAISLLATGGLGAAWLVSYLQFLDTQYQRDAAEAAEPFYWWQAATWSAGAISLGLASGAGIWWWLWSAEDEVD